MLECVICRRVQLPGHEVFLVLTPDERRENHLHKRAVSHGYCDECFVIFMRAEGVPEEEIQMELDGIKARKGR